jgi:hypothetical protein
MDHMCNKVITSKGRLKQYLYKYLVWTLLPRRSNFFLAHICADLLCMSQVRCSFRPPGAHSQNNLVVSILLTKADDTTNFKYLQIVSLIWLKRH